MNSNHRGAQLTSMRMSMHSVLPAGGAPLLSGGSPPSLGPGSQSSVFNMPASGSSAGTSVYPPTESPQQQPPKTVVRIRGKGNQTIETSGSLALTLEEEKRAAERRRQIRRSNERLRMLENMERDRQDKMEADIQRLRGPNKKSDRLKI